MKLLLLALISLPLWAQTNYVLSCPATAPAGTQVSCTIIATGGSLVAAQFSTTVTSGSGATQVAWNIATALTNKTVWTALPNPIVLLYGANQAVIPTGAIISTLSFTMPSANANITINSCYASDAGGGSIPCTTNPTQVVGLPLSKCDIDGDGLTTQNDVNAMRLQIQSGPPNPNKNITHLQQVQNAVLGMPCTLP